MATPRPRPSGKAKAGTDEARAARLRRRTLELLPLLRPPVAQHLPPDMAGTRAFLLASHIANEELHFAQTLHATRRSRHEQALLLRALRNNLARDLHLLPLFIDNADGSTLPGLVCRFIAGERPTKLQAACLPPAANSFSAQPLPPIAAHHRLRELAALGVDISLLKAQLALSPTERIESMLALAALCDALRAGSTTRP